MGDLSAPHLPSGASESRTAIVAPRIYCARDLSAVPNGALARAERLHFNWIGIPAAPGRAGGFDTEALLRTTVDIAARKTCLKVLVDVDFGALLGAHPDKVFVDVAEEIVSALASLPVQGIRCFAAHHVSPHDWHRLIQEARAVAPRLLWVADTLGAPGDATAAALDAGFDWFFSSVRWWDGKASWALDQYERFRSVAHSIGFPEESNGARLHDELRQNGIGGAAEIAAYYSLRYALAAFFGAGVAMPAGYETASSGNGGAPATGDIDISATITAINRIKATHPALGLERPQRRLPAGDVLALAKIEENGRFESCFVANITSEGRSVDLAKIGGDFRASLANLHDVMPGTTPRTTLRPIWLAPYEWCLLMAPPETGDTTARFASRQAPRSRTKTLARAPAIAIEKVAPEIDGGPFPVKRTVGEDLEVSADIFSAGHEVVDAALLYRHDGERLWSLAPMQHVDNDRWAGRAPLLRNRRYFYCIEAWIDVFASWCRGIAAKYDAGQDVTAELIEGRLLLTQAADRVRGPTRQLLRNAVEASKNGRTGAAIDLLLAADVEAAMREWGPRQDVTRYGREIEVVVDRPAARFGAWYEMFPRSQGTENGKSASFRDCIARLAEIRQMGFDVVYLVPIHPIGERNRKGRNNAVKAEAGDPGSPYAIGDAGGGHTAVHPELGTLEDFRAFVAACTALGMEVALDFAVQCSLDHPWLREHPEWFIFRSDGSIKYAENPPKKYQDIVNLNFRTADQAALWQALRDVVLFWISHDVRIFRVDNPHTKPYPFWEWLIRSVQAEYPDVIFLAEAFTRPKPLRYLAKLGFTQSYTYFTWRNHKQEITDYFTELTRSETKDYLRPNLFTNTPDILPDFLQHGGPGAFRIRLVLAAALGGLYGIYNGFELCEARALPYSEEYLDSEKYQYKVWDWDRPGNIKSYIAEVNRIRRENAAFADWLNLEFLPCDNDQVLFFGRFGIRPFDHALVAVSLDPRAPQAARLELPLARLGLSDGDRLLIEDLWTHRQSEHVGRLQQISLDPSQPALFQRLQSAAA